MNSLYSKFLNLKQEILKHKWIESEKNNCDIGFEKALIDWIVNHKKDWNDAHKKVKDDIDNQ